MPTKTLFCGCTHGDEPIGKYIFDRYPVGRNEHFEWRSIIANPEAMYLNQRYIDTDLNRAFPGKPNGNHEEQRAYQLNQILSQFELVIDWHQSISKMEDMIFVPKLNPYLKEVCQYFDIKHILELDKGRGDYEGLLFCQVENGMGVEYGRLYNFQDVCRRFERDIHNLLSKRVVTTNPNHYQVWGKVELEFKSKLNLKDFQKLTKEELEILEILEEDIYPSFVDSYPGIYCLLLQKI
jgi:succinylglutamate desuccinylase